MLIFYLSLIEDKNNYDYFIEIYNKYKEYMYNIAMSYTNDHNYAQDSLQTAFVGIAKNIDTLKNLDEEKLEIYVLKVAKNSAINILDNKNIVIDFETNCENLPSDEDLMKNVLDKELLTLVFEFIKSMPRIYRDILTLYFLHGLSLRKIAIALNLPKSTIERRFHKGQNLVIEKFKRYRRK